MSEVLSDTHVSAAYIMHLHKTVIAPTLVPTFKYQNILAKYSDYFMSGFNSNSNK